jgi:hypothetical protein
VSICYGDRELVIRHPIALTDQKSPITYHFCLLCAVSSVVEHYLDTVGVRGSKPLPRTIFPIYAPTIYAFLSASLGVDCNTFLMLSLDHVWEVALCTLRNCWSKASRSNISQSLNHRNMEKRTALPREPITNSAPRGASNTLTVYSERYNRKSAQADQQEINEAAISADKIRINKQRLIARRYTHGESVESSRWRTAFRRLRLVCLRGMIVQTARVASRSRLMCLFA